MSADLGAAVKSVSAGAYHTCAVKADDLLACWGYNYYGETNVPADLGAVKSVSAGAFHTCAVKADDDSLACWGYNDFGQTSAPADLPTTTSDLGRRPAGQGVGRARERHRTAADAVHAPSTNCCSR